MKSTLNEFIRKNRVVFLAIGILGVGIGVWSAFFATHLSGQTHFILGFIAGLAMALGMIGLKIK